LDRWAGQNVMASPLGLGELVGLAYLAYVYTILLSASSCDFLKD